MAAMAVFGLLAWCVAWRYERNPRRRIGDVPVRWSS